MGDPYPAPSPNPVIQKAFAEKQVEFEQWTMLTLTLRLMAAALGLPFPANLSWEVLWQKTIPALFQLPILLKTMKSAWSGLIPDLCFIHGWLADC